MLRERGHFLGKITVSIQLRKLGGVATIDTEALAAELRRQLRGEVRFDEGSRALYATDSSNYRQVPIGVVIPKDVDDVIKTVAICYRYGTPLLARSGGTSLAGQCCNVAVVIDMSKYTHGMRNEIIASSLRSTKRLHNPRDAQRDCKKITLVYETPSQGRSVLSLSRLSIS